MKNQSSIQFFKEGVIFRLNKQDVLRNWIIKVIRKAKQREGEINYIFCNDRYLLQINKDFLNHNYYTDIITFNTSIEKNSIDADIYISIDRVKKNSRIYGTTFADELHRVMIHGILHLLGNDDKTSSGKTKMRKLEDECLTQRQTSNVKR